MTPLRTLITAWQSCAELHRLNVELGAGDVGDLAVARSLDKCARDLAGVLPAEPGPAPSPATAVDLVMAARGHLWAALPRRTLSGPHLPPKVAEAIHAALAAIQDWGGRELDSTMPADPLGDL
jgi:hypothetical protein